MAAAIGDIYEGGDVLVQPDSTVSAVVLGGLTDVSVGTGTDVSGGPTMGSTFSEFEAISRQVPEISFTSRGSIATALANFGLLGTCLRDASNPGVGIEAYFQKRSECGTYVAGSNHIKKRIANGILIPTSLNASFAGDASVGYRALAVKESGLDALIITDSVALPSGGVIDERYALYDVRIAGVDYPAVQDVTIDFGIQIIRTGGASGNADELITPTHVAIQAVTPTITINTVDPEILLSAKIGLDGAAPVLADSRIRLIKRTDGGKFVSLATTEHILITMEGLATVETSGASNDKENATATITIRGKSPDGTTHPISINTASAIS